MVKTKDIGLEHIIKLNIRAARNANEIVYELSRKYGDKRAKEIIKEILDDDTGEDGQASYDKKNADYETAMIFSGGYDADIIRQACNWVNEHKDAFGDEILEIGCDCGFMTTFLGSLFPEKHIVSIDRNRSGIEIAKRNADKFGLKNVELICEDVTKLSGRTFDTVFSMRTMQENGCLEGEEDLSNELFAQADIYTDAKQTYADKLSSVLKTNGKLVSIERLGRNAMFLAWIQALTNAGLKVNLDSFEELQCKEVGEISTFEALIFSKEDCEGVDVFESFMDCVAKCMDTSLPQYEGWDAKIMYAFNGGKLVDGIEAMNIQVGMRGKVVCRMHKHDDTCVLLYQNFGGSVFLGYYDISQKEACLEAINKAANDAKNMGYNHITKLKE